MKIDLREYPAVYMNLEQHVEKNERMQKMLKHFGFKNIIRVEGVPRPDNTVAGCSAAHYNGLREFDNQPFILFEDDCQLKNLNPEIEIPDDADAVYLGVSSWGRMNGHSGPFVQYTPTEYEGLYRIYNMLSGHAVLYLKNEYIDMCRRICYHAGYIIEDYQDIGFAEIQRWFKVYAINDPLFYQTSSNGTYEKLTSYPTQECFQYNKNYFLPEKIL